MVKSKASGVGLLKFTFWHLLSSAAWGKLFILSVLQILYV